MAVRVDDGAVGAGRRIPSMTLRIKGAVVCATLIVACATLIVACVLAVPAKAQSASTPALQVHGQDRDDPVVAIVDGESIHLSELISAKGSMQEQQGRDAPLEQIYPSLLDQLVERRIVTRAATIARIEDDPEVRMRVARARENVLLEAYMSKRIALEISDEKLRQRYRRQSAADGGEEEVHARHILLESEADARAVLGEIAKGVAFTELAKKRSKGPSAPRGGDLGFFRRQQMVPEFSAAAFALGAGEVSAPVKTQFGWHVIQVVERRRTEPPAFEQVVEKLRSEVAREAVLAVVTELRSKADVQLFNPDGSPLVVPNLIRPVK
jgi:peptidyl-prolyl cis-trans isomerase C